ncbi:MAG TPA: DUF5666 domain-containing protein [Anaerolineales bacterium]
MTEQYDALENCLEAIEQGADVEQSLRRYPNLAGELRPLLEGALTARSASRVHVPLEVRRRGRARLMSQVQVSEESRGARVRRAIPIFPRLAASIILVAALVLTSTGLVSASSGALPGQQLYPVKRTWETVRLLFVFSPQQRDLLQSDYDQERIDETSELLGRRLAAPISFSGILASQSDGQWLVSGIPVSVTGSTIVPARPLLVGVPITINGVTRADGKVEAQHIDVLQPGSSLPPLAPSEDNESEVKSPAQPGVSNTPVPTPTARAAQPAPSATESEHISYQFTGVVQSASGTVWQINGQPVQIDSAQIRGQVTVGSIVRFQGYYDVDGKFVLTSIQPETGGSESQHGASASATPSSGESDGGTESP